MERESNRDSTGVGEGECESGEFVLEIFVGGDEAFCDSVLSWPSAADVMNGSMDSDSIERSTGSALIFFPLPRVGFGISSSDLKPPGLAPAARVRRAPTILKVVK